MIDFSQVDSETLLARGQYATVRAAHEDEKKELSILCGLLQSYASQILKVMQPNDGEVPMSIDGLLSAGRDVINKIEQTASRIESLAKQRAELKQKAWPK